ncbi:MAG: DUF1592 domain-containing protein [Gemmatimonadota bacterium]|uniref:DUF1592 domain-containing protein n=1 Tax=Candidatus Palauibacter scopulicola TaxID=3056741 RepID=UPI0023962091|nr:DUF1592 domain-containing protein [Candidatus Palauibacter scopulicola]MDE2661830.1 DUF1592 domain-containing protein [Candidatus Palauibacter scopulicola]
MKTLSAGAVLWLWFALMGQPSGDGASGSAPLSEFDLAALADTAELTAVVQRYCVRCHNGRLLRGNLTLEAFDVDAAHERAPTAEKMIRKLRAGMMPPPGQRRPPPDTLLALVETLETVVDREAARDRNPGSRRFQRLNRAEYERVIRDLLDLEIDASRWLPADTYLGAFDNMADAQGLSTTLLEAYLRAATEVSRIAVGNPAALSKTAKYTNPIDVSQHAWDRIEGAPYGTRGGMVVTHDFPVDGEYVISLETLFGQGTGFQDVDISIDGEGVALLGLEHGGRSTVPIRTEPIYVQAGQREVAAAFVRTIEGPYEDRLKTPGWSFVGGEDSQAWANYGITALPHLSDLMITGPRRSAGLSETASRRKVFDCHPGRDAAVGEAVGEAAGEARACAASIVTRLARAAYRRPVTEADLAGPMAFYDDAAAEAAEDGSDGFEIGVRTALQAILANPSFIFRLEQAPPEAAPGESYRIADVDLASRLSFFLWAASPDDELLTVAAEGRLSDPAVLEAQVRRMLADPRAEALSTRFASQWLRLQDAEDNQPEPYLYPDFTGQLREDLVRETQLFFDHLVREDRSLLELFTADYTFLNERLAGHYGIEGVSGPGFRRVSYPDDSRRGVLGHGSVLLLTSMSARTSPVLRGKWVMEVLMGTPPPPPPPDIPAFDETESARGGRLLTTRERLEMHAASPTCRACHRFMDPIGLALDNYDVTGRVRVRENGVALDTRGTFYDGSDVSTPAELVDLLMKRPIPLVRNFTAHLLAYAVGRRAEYFDQPGIRAIAREAEADGYRMSSFILGVVNSDAFRLARPAPAVEEVEGS